MPKVATRLKRFNSCTFGVGRHAEFASNNLRYVRLNRCEGLHSLNIYAPRLEHLSLQACYYDFDGRFNIQDKHAKLFKKPPYLPSYFKTSHIEIVTTDASMSAKTEKLLKGHPRVREYYDSYTLG
jgi:hypothetical protein